MKLIIASSNEHKLDEIRKILPENIKLISASEAGYKPDIEETGKTFEENAFIKAKTLYDFTGEASIADDSGLEVRALKNAPGVKSARYAGEPSDSNKNINLLLEKLNGIKDRTAHFVTVICLVNGPLTLYFEGSIEGKITEFRKGEGGFGYDPIFIPDNYDQTFAEMDPEHKNSISHRKRALDKMIPFLQFLKI